MRRFSFYAIGLALCFCATVSAQHPLVQYQENDDPCANFKMRILVPGNQVDDVKRRALKLNDGIDPRMVWNPCPRTEAQFAVVVPDRKREQLWKLPVPQSFGDQMSTVVSEKKKPAKFPFPQLASPFDKWRQ